MSEDRVKYLSWCFLFVKREIVYSDDEEETWMNFWLWIVKSLLCCFLSAAPGVSLWVFCTDVVVYINKLNVWQNVIGARAGEAGLKRRSEVMKPEYSRLEIFESKITFKMNRCILKELKSFGLKYYKYINMSPSRRSESITPRIPTFSTSSHVLTTIFWFWVPDVFS